MSHVMVVMAISDIRSLFPLLWQNVFSVTQQWG